MEKEFNRTDGLFSLCGLNCGLCPMQIRGACSGCFNGSTCYRSCPLAPCSVRHGNVDYCFQCSEYPCKRYEGIDRHDSLISHRNQKKDMAKAKEVAGNFKSLNGEVEVYACCDTLQVKDYSKFDMASFSEKHKKKMREKQFPKDLENAFQLGARLASEETAGLK